MLERDPGPRKGGSAIGLWPNAFRALDALGVADHLREQHPLISRQANQVVLYTVFVEQGKGNLAI